jgi:hypothetical protein
LIWYPHCLWCRGKVFQHKDRRHQNTQGVVALVEKHANSQMQKDDGVLGTNELFQLTFTTHFTSEAARKRQKEKQRVCHTVALPFYIKKVSIRQKKN